MSDIVAMCGSSRPYSRTQILIDHAVRHLRADDFQVTAFSVTDLPAEVLIEGRVTHSAAIRLLSTVARARGIVIGTPVYKAAYSGALKTLLDLLPQGGLTGKVVLPLATGGSAGHMLAIDYALRPVLMALDARQVVRGCFAHEDEFVTGGTGPMLAAHVEAGLCSAVRAFIHAIGAPDPARAALITR